MLPPPLVTGIQRRPCSRPRCQPATITSNHYYRSINLSNPIIKPFIPVAMTLSCGKKVHKLMMCLVKKYFLLVCPELIANHQRLWVPPPPK